MENIKAFAKLYGFVRWFHPSDEAQQIDWERFACYGVKTVENAPNSDALKDSLLKLYLPIAPSLEIYGGSEKHDFDISKITPPDTTEFKPVYWQHSGVKLNHTPANLFNSIRVNKLNKSKYKNCPINQYYFDASIYKGEKLVLTLKIKNQHRNYCEIFFDVLNRYEAKKIEKAIKPLKIENEDWVDIKITQKVEEGDVAFFFGLAGLNFLVDDIKISLKRQNQTDSVIFKTDFNRPGSSTSDLKFNNLLPFKIEKVVKDTQNDSCLSVKFDNTFTLFSTKPVFGEIIKEPIHPELKINLPLVLMMVNDSTFPESDTLILNDLTSNLNLVISTVYEKWGGLIIVWNIIQHFFPYFAEIDVDWDNELETSIREILNEEDFQKTLKKLTAKLNDGHLGVSSPEYNPQFYLPISWEWIEGKLVIIGVYNETSEVQPGNIVLEINHRNPKKYFRELERYVSASTKGFLNVISQRETLKGPPNEYAELKIKNNFGKIQFVKLQYSFSDSEFNWKTENQENYKRIDNNFFYLNLDKISMTEIYSLMPELVSCNGIICDLRGYPNRNNEFLLHLMNQELNCGTSVMLPQTIYPNQKKITYGYSNNDEYAKPREPFINCPVVFITDSRAISMAESALLIVKHFDLGIIIGQPTAGTNGMVNYCFLPDGTVFRFTGAKVIAFDGSQHFGVGVLPDVYVEKTIKGVRKGRDEILDEAIRILKINK